MGTEVIRHTTASATVRYADLRAESEGDCGEDGIVWQEEAETQH